MFHFGFNMNGWLSRILFLSSLMLSLVFALQNNISMTIFFLSLMILSTSGRIFN